MRITDPGFLRLNEMHKKYKEMTAEERKDFYQSKCAYYEYAVKFALIGACIASLGYLVSDYQLNGNDIRPTLIPRLSILIPMIIYLLAERNLKDRRKIVFLDFLLCHLIIWATIWAVYNLRIKIHFSEGSMIMNLIMLVIGFAASQSELEISYVFFFADILVSNQFNHYPNLNVILSLNLPCCFAVLLAQYILNLGYLDHYLTGKKLEDIMVRDPLTGVFNRRKLEQLVTDDRINGHSGNISVVMLDIDLFKNVNDKYGHYVGDEVLSFLGRSLLDSVGDQGSVIRFGGEEFMIIFFDTDTAAAQRFMDTEREKIADSSDAAVHFTISAGIAAYGGEFSSCMKQADEALYQAKEHGRNRVCIYTK